MQDIDALLDDTDEQLLLVEQLYRKALENKQIGQRLKPRMKNVLDNQRSALDYVAHHIYEQYATKRAQSYYPIANSPDDFESFFDKNLPGVRVARPDIAEAIERHQKWQPDHEWLGWLNDLRKESSHRILSPVTIERGQRSTFQMPNGRELDVVMIGDARVQHAITGEVGGPELFMGRQADGTAEWTEILFNEPKQPALYVLARIQQGVKETITDVTQAAGLS